MHHKHCTEEEALTALLEGQEEGLDFFFYRYYAPLIYFAFKLVRDQHLAEELSAEAFVKLWKHRLTLSGEGPLKVWLYRIVRNAAIDHLRKVKRIHLTGDSLNYTHETAEATVLHRMIEAETIHRIHYTLEGLPPGCRQVFQMFYFQGKSHEEIARELRLSPSTVRGQKKKALRLLKSKLL